MGLEMSRKKMLHSKSSIHGFKRIDAYIWWFGYVMMDLLKNNGKGLKCWWRVIKRSGWETLPSDGNVRYDKPMGQKYQYLD